MKHLAFIDSHLNSIEITDDDVIFRLHVKENEENIKTLEIHISTETAKCMCYLLKEGLEIDD